jgi:hypothetical protein
VWLLWCLCGCAQRLWCSTVRDSSWVNVALHVERSTGWQHMEICRLAGHACHLAPGLVLHGML